MGGGLSTGTAPPEHVPFRVPDHVPAESMRGGQEPASTLKRANKENEVLFKPP